MRHQKTGRSDSIPNNKAYEDLTEAEKNELFEKIRKICAVNAYLICKTNRGLDRAEVESDLLTHAYLALEKLKKKKKRRGANLVGYIGAAVQSKKKDIITNVINDKAKNECAKAFGLDFISPGGDPEDEFIQREEAEYAKEWAQPIIKFIVECCNKTNTAINPEDWVGTAMRVMRCTRRKKLPLRLAKKLDELEAQFRKGGAIFPNEIPGAGRPNTRMGQVLRECVRENPKVSPREIKERMDREDILYNPSSIAPMASVLRKKMGQETPLSAAGTGARTRVIELIEKGITEQSEIEAILLREKLHCRSITIFKYIKEYERVHGQV